MVLLQEFFPKDWGNGNIVPIYKNGCQYDPSNYRGITIANTFSKIFTSLLNNRLTKFLSTNNLMNSEQIGFKKGSRTSDHIFVLKCLIESAKRIGKPLYVCFIDFSKAFDTVWQSGLFFKLLNTGISNKVVNIIRSMYSKLYSRVSIASSISNDFPVLLGTRQGCPLSPTLFNIFLNDLPNLLNKCGCNPVYIHGIPLHVIMYADDVALFSHSENGLKKSLSVVNIYASKWQLIINVKKNQNHDI